MNFNLSMLIVTLTLYSGICHSNDIVLMEARAVDHLSVRYQLNYLRENERDSKTLVEQAMPIEIIECFNDTLIYLTDDGSLWQMTLSSNTTTLVGKTAKQLSKGGTFGHSLLNMAEHRLIAFQNNGIKNEYALTRYAFDGTAELLASGIGTVFAIWEVQPDVIELITRDALIDVNADTKKTTKIIPFNKDGLSSIMKIKDGHSILAKDKSIEVRTGVFGKTIMHFNLTHGFGLIADFEAKKGKLLAVVVDPDYGRDELMEIEIKNKKGHVIYDAESIGGACYL